MNTPPDLPFETALDRIERIVADLEQGAPELAAALVQFEEAVRLLAHCRGQIDGAERTIGLLTGVDDQGQPLTPPFDATATIERESSPSSRKVRPGIANPSPSPDSDDSTPP